MPLLVYRPQLFQNTAENLQFRALCTELKRRIDVQEKRKYGRKDLCIMVGNFNFAEKELDSFLIKRDGIVLIEFKNYGGKISVTNNEWKGESEGRAFTIKGGSGGKTPLDQARLNRNAFIRNLTDSGALNKDAAQKITTLVVFNHRSEIENKLRFNVQTWLNLTDNTGFFGTMESIVNKDMNLSPVDIKRIADRIVLEDDYIVEEFSDLDFLDNIWNNPVELQAFSDTIEGRTEFLEEPDPFVADQNGELDLNPEQNPEITADPVEASSPILVDDEKTNISAEAIPCERVPLIISNYINLIQQAAMPGVSYNIYDCKESYPLVDFDISLQYLIKVLVEPKSENAETFKKFLHRNVYLGPDCLYWCFGEQIPVITPTSTKLEDPSEEGLIFRNSSTILAPWLDSFIFDKLGASYDPRYKRFAYNDDLTEEEARIYLGTYFPRSYAENFLIFENLLMHSGYRSKIESKRHLSVLSVGAGTGGDIVGLLTAIDKFLPFNIDISITAFDANKNSLDLQKEVIDRYKALGGRNIELVQFNERIADEITLKEFASKAIPDNSIDFILFAKIGCELHGKKVFGSDNVFEVCLRHLMPKISLTGLMLVLDVTTNVDGHEYMPVILNRGINHFVAQNSQYSTLLPLSCHFYENECSNPCFIQQEFHVTHCKKSQDLSKVCYRILGRKEMCEAMTKNNKKRFVINPSKAFSAPREAVCGFTRNYLEDSDAYNLN